MQQARHFGRYLNRAQREALEMKSDLTCYEYKQTLISDLNPGPRYPEQALLPQHKIIKKRNAVYNLERIRSSAITKKRNEARFYQGRVHSHLKLEQLKEDVAAIRESETINTKSLA